MKLTNNLTEKTTPFDALHRPVQDSNIFTNKTDDNILFSINLVLIISSQEYTSELCKEYWLKTWPAHEQTSIIVDEKRTHQSVTERVFEEVLR